MASSSIISSIADNGGDFASFASSLPSSSSSSGTRDCIWDLRVPPEAALTPPDDPTADRGPPSPSEAPSEPSSSAPLPVAGKEGSLRPPRTEEDIGTAPRPVQCWLGELRWHTEPECSHILQSKSILSRQEAEEPPPVAVCPRAAIELISERSSFISCEFRKVFKLVSRARVKDLHALVGGLTARIRSLLYRMTSMAVLTSPQHLKGDSALRRYCNRVEEVSKRSEFQLMFLLQLAEAELYFLAQNGRLPSAEPLTRELTRLGHAFSRLVDAVLVDLARRLVADLSLAPSPVSALRDITHLAMRFDHLASILTKLGALTLLIDLCRDVTRQRHWAMALRAVSAVCCIPEAVQRFEEDRGLLLLRLLLCDSGLPEAIRCEAAGVVAQITSPCLCGTDGVHPLGNSLRSLIDEFVRSLTMLSVEANHPDVFLLSAAALANLTFLEPAVYDALLRYNTVRVLVDACQLNKADTVFARDQVATLFANMAVCASCHPEITARNGVELLLHFLADSPRDCRSAAEREACARLQQKAAIALGRLSSSEPGNAQIVIECGGLRRLGALCRRPEERAGSDAVLVAALAALRKIHLACGAEDFDPDDLDQLVLPKMIDAFLACSKMEESFV